MKFSVVTVLVLVAHVKSMYLDNTHQEGESSVSRIASQDNMDKYFEAHCIRTVKERLSHPRYDPATLENEALFVAMEKQDYATVKYLLADPKLDSIIKSEALLYACMSRDASLVKDLLADNSFNPSAKIGVAVKELCAQSYDLVESTRIEIVELLLSDPRADPSTDHSEAFQNSCSNAHYEISKLILSLTDTDPSVNENEALRFACKNGNYKVIRLLLEDPRVDPSANNNEAIQSLCYLGLKKLVKILLSDPRVDPSMVEWENVSRTQYYDAIDIVKFISYATEHSNLDLQQAKNIKWSSLNGRDHLDIVIARNSANPNVRAFLFRKQLELLNISDKLREAPLFQHFINNVALMSSVLTCDEIEKAIQKFLPYSQNFAITGMPEIDAKILFHMVFPVKK